MRLEHISGAVIASLEKCAKCDHELVAKIAQLQMARKLNEIIDKMEELDGKICDRSGTRRKPTGSDV